MPYFCLIKFIPRGTSTKNFYDHKEIGRFLQGKKSAKCGRYQNILILIIIKSNLHEKDWDINE
jgi:hypothetical protein